MNIIDIITKIFTSSSLWQAIALAWSSIISDVINQNNIFMTSIFDLNVVQNFIVFIETIGSILFVFGIAFAFSEWATDCNENGKVNIQSTFKNCIIGFAALLSFAYIPVLLLKWINELAYILMKTMNIDMISQFDNALALDFLGGFGAPFFFFIMAFSIVKIFLANIKRGGIMLTLITVGSLHMFSIPRGYTDAFGSWCKQVLGLCITSFMQNVLLTLGLLVFSSQLTSQSMILGTGIMLSAAEVPRILQQFGLDTSMKVNFSQAIMGASNAVNIVSSIGSAAAA